MSCIKFGEFYPLFFFGYSSCPFPLSSLTETLIMQMLVSHKLLKPLFLFPSSFFLSAPQTQYFLLSYRNVCRFFLLHAQTCCWNPVVNFYFSCRVFGWFFLMVSLSLLAFSFCLCIIFLISLVICPCFPLGLWTCLNDFYVACLMSGLFWGPFLLINFVPLNGLYFPISLYAFWFVVEHWTLEYNVITLEIRFFLFSLFAVKTKIF